MSTPPDLASASRLADVRHHAMSIDVEDYFQVWALANHYERAQWDHLPSRVEGNTARLIEALEAKGRRATFFVLGWVAERHPALIRRIVDGGHELASHGYGHQLVYGQTADEFRADIVRAKAILEDLSGEEVTGYRAPSFSIGQTTPWAYDILAETGHHYSSSSHPVANDHYVTDQEIIDPAPIGSILEIPVSTFRFGNWRLPCAGGGYFRLLPQAWISWSLDKLAAKAERPILFYLHPWEIDPDQPRPPELSLKTRIRHYHGLDRCMARYRRLLDKFSWRPVDELYGFRGVRR